MAVFGFWRMAAGPEFSAVPAPVAEPKAARHGGGMREAWMIDQSERTSPCWDCGSAMHGSTGDLTLGHRAPSRAATYRRTGGTDRREI